MIDLFWLYYYRARRLADLHPTRARLAAVIAISGLTMAVVSAVACQW